jgi:nucleoside-diphosphate-sugar epimerase
MATTNPLRVAVTGGSGRIGRAVVKELTQRGHQVLNLDRRQSPDKLARFMYVDLRHREQVQPVLEQVDAVVHLAEMTNANLPYSADEIFSHNTRVTSVVLQTAADLHLQRAIYTSSCQVYGCWDSPKVPPLRLPFDETHPVQPQNVYSLSKVANESYAHYVAKHHGLSVAIFRLPWVMQEEHDGHAEVPERWWHWLEHDAGPTDGLETYIHAKDVALAYALALEHPKSGCETYHLTAAEVLSANPLRQRLEHHKDYPSLPDNWPDFKSPLLLEKARQHFGWEPTINLLDHYRRWKAMQAAK